jgi:hypothetical protein
MRKHAPCDPSVAALVKPALEVHLKPEGKETFDDADESELFVAVLF